MAKEEMQMFSWKFKRNIKQYITVHMLIRLLNLIEQWGVNWSIYCTSVQLRQAGQLKSLILFLVVHSVSVYPLLCSVHFSNCCENEKSHLRCFCSHGYDKIPKMGMINYQL